MICFFIQFVNRILKCTRYYLNIFFRLLYLLIKFKKKINEKTDLRPFT